MSRREGQHLSARLRAHAFTLTTLMSAALSPSVSSAQAGSAQAGSAQAGSAQAGSAQAGSAQAGSAQAGSAQVSAQPLRYPIIALGDLHADLAAAQRAFHLAGVTNSAGEWTLKDSLVVQTGDLTDRGPDGEPLLRWVRGLEAQAKAHNSELIVLLGNHETMNLMGDWRYVSRADVVSFGGLEPRKKAFSLPQGEWARWLLNKQAVLQLGDTLFVHGGVSRAFARPAEALSAEVREALLGRAPREILGDRGPLWYRGYWLQEEAVACAEAREVLKALGAKRMVMGHTTTRDGRIHARCQGSLFAIDTGISRVYGAHPAALHLYPDHVEAIYPTGKERL